MDKRFKNDILGFEKHNLKRCLIETHVMLTDKDGKFWVYNKSADGHVPFVLHILLPTTKTPKPYLQLLTRWARTKHFLNLLEPNISFEISTLFCGFYHSETSCRNIVTLTVYASSQARAVRNPN